MRHAAEERAARSAMHLPKVLGALLRRWAGARRCAWKITDAWTPLGIANHLIESQRSGNWSKLTAVPRDVAATDDAVRTYCGVFEGGRDAGLSRHRYIGGERALTIDEIHVAMRAEKPSMTREKLRKTLHRANRNHTMRRVKRGVYIKEPYARSRWHEIREFEEDEANALWWLRSERRRFLTGLVLLSHYLLPKRASYRKARELGVGERTYFYYLNAALEDVAYFSNEPFPRPTNCVQCYPSESPTNFSEIEV